MRTPWLIAPDGKLYDFKDFFSVLPRLQFKKLFKDITEYTLRPTKLIMTQDDWDDIVKFTKES